ncbi:MAG TPA: helix-turn-helix transcriptional regulator [Steroidobacteraceae bacterium]|nr:helix-turn-helix transcriptional regulator [Steroidobacteraceae bacterium]
MSQKRQPAAIDETLRQKGAITTLARDYAAGHAISRHYHDRDQLIYASRGVMTVGTPDGTWVVPTHRAVWVPAGIAHRIRMSGIVEMRTLYLASGVAKHMPKKCCVVNVSPLLRELIMAACRHGNLHGAVSSQRHIMQMIADELSGAETLALRLPHPSDPRAAKVAAVLLNRPDDPRTLAQICELGLGGRRTIERAFVEDVGMTFGKWRQQLRLIHAMQLLAAGAKVTHAALEAGYSTPSAFIAMFKRTLGTTPKAYFKASAG